MKYLRLGYTIDQPTTDRIISIIKDLWGCLCKYGVQRTIIGYEFSIDMGNTNPV